MAKRRIWTVGELIRELQKHAEKRGLDEPIGIAYPRIGEWGSIPAGKSPVGHVRFRRGETFPLQIVVYEREFYG